MRRIIYIICSIVAFFALAVGVFFTSDYFANKWESERLQASILTDTKGKPWRISDLKDKIGVVFFGYTFCPDACPTALNDISIALAEMGSKRDLFQPVFISVDPGRDTPEIIGKYVAHFGKSIVGLTGSDSELKKISFNFGATYTLQKKGPKDQEYLVNHSANFFMVTSSGQKLPMPVTKNSDELQRVMLKVKDRILKDNARWQ